MTTKGCRVCGIETNSRCNRCHVASYCSRKCQSKEWPLHKQICFPELHKRLKAVHEIMRGDSSYNPSQGNFIIEGGCEGWITPYHGSDLYSCPICGNSAVPHGGKIREYFDDDMSWGYLRCVECGKADKQLCPRSWMEKSQCQCRLIYILFILSQFLGQNDVVRVIGRIMKPMNLCLPRWKR